MVTAAMKLWDAYAALPPSVRKASGFPSSLQLFWRLCRPRRSHYFFYGANGKPDAFRTGTRQSRNQLIADEYGSRVSKGRKTQRGSGEIELTIYNEGV